jgi:hypothetical protein
MRISLFVCRQVLPVAAVLCFAIGQAAAQGAPGQVDVRQACTPDAMRLCGDTIPDVTKTTACMKAKRSQLSPECRVAMGGGGRQRAATHHYHHHKH